MRARTDTKLWLRTFHPAPGARARLVCFPHAGGSASYFYRMSGALAGVAQVLAVQYPGRQDRRHEPMAGDLLPLAGTLAEMIASEVGPPVALLGHSMGALLAFEVARRLEERGGPVSMLFASGRGAPSVPPGERVDVGDDGALLAEVARLDGTSAGLLADRELMRLVLPALRGDYGALQAYRYQAGPPLSCPLTVLTGDRDPVVTPAAARQWSQHTSGAFDLQVFGGGHFFLTSAQEDVTRLVAARLRAA